MPSDTFYYDLGIQGTSRKQWLQKSYDQVFGPLEEWVSKESVKPLCKIEFESVFQVMIDLGVQVYFVANDLFQEIKAALKDKKDLLKRRRLLRSLISENQKINKNHKALFDYNLY